MKKLLFPSAIACALCCVALVTPASALPVTSNNVTTTWDVHALTPMYVPTVRVKVDFDSDNQNSTTKHFDEPFALYRQYDTTSHEVSSKWLSNDIAPGKSQYYFLYQNTTTDQPSTDTSWYLTYFLPGDQDAVYPNIAASRRDNHTY